MKKTLMMMTAALVFSGGMAFALTTDEVISDMKAQGYTRIEVKTGPTQIKVEAIRGTEKLEVIYDAATGSVLKTETGTVAALENTNPGVSVRDRNKDFVKLVRADDTAGNDDDSNDDQGSGNDDANDDDDHSGSGNDGSDDNGDDDNSDDDNGDDDNGDDDNSGDDDGDDDSGSDDDGDHGSDDHGSNDD